MDRVTDPADPTRCKGSCGHAQCWNRAVSGYDFCRIHAPDAKDKAAMEDVRGYLLAKIDDRVRLAQLSESDELKDMRREVGFIRMMIERYWNTIKSDNDLIQRSGAINALFLTLERMNKSQQQMEERLQSLIGRSKVIALAQEWAKIIMDELEVLPNHEPVAERIIHRILGTMSRKNKLLEAPIDVQSSEG
jgi:hypothetical protein